MLRNYLKIAFRTAWHHPTITAINVLGLTIGLTAGLLITTFVLDELSFDRFWTHADSLYRLVTVQQNGQAEEQSSRVMSGLAPTLKNAFPEIEAYTRDTDPRSSYLSRKNRQAKLRIWRVEPGAFTLFDIGLLRGSIDTGAYHRPTIVLSETMARTLFGQEDPIGQQVSKISPYSPAAPLTVVGVMRDLPTNTQLYADALMPISFRPDENNSVEFGFVFQQYVQLAPHTNPAQFIQKANRYLNQTFKPKQPIRIALQPITDVRLYSTGHVDHDERQGDIQYVYLFAVIGLFLLLLACVNFVNLTTARSLQRSRETGVRKVLGAQRSTLIGQYLGEAGLVFGISLLLAVGLYALCRPLLFDFLGRSLTVDPLTNGWLLASVAGASLLISLLAGLYPAFVLSAFQPARVLKGVLKSGRRGQRVRQGLVVGQFVVSLVLIVATLVVYWQVRYVTQRNLGFRKDNLMLMDGVAEDKTTAFRHELLQSPAIVSVSFTNWQPGSGSEGSMSRRIDDPDKPGAKTQLWGINADFDFLRTLQIPLVAGRDFSDRFASDRQNLDSLEGTNPALYEELSKERPLIVNQTLVRKLGLQQPIGYQLNKQGLTGRIIGVVRDFNSGPLHHSLPILYIQANAANVYGSPLIRVRAGQTDVAVRHVQQTWRRFFPDRLFKYTFADDELDRFYQQEARLGKLIGLFAGLSILICCLGLFGLAAFTAEQRTKEIGVRKVLGASVMSIVTLLSGDFLKLILIALVVASPLAWWTMTQWLQHFAYRVSIEWWYFALAGLLAIIIALVTVSYQSIRAALINPINSLRSE